jgi:hypothetical protein
MKTLPKLFFVAWGLFVISFALPAFGDSGDALRGWRCALMCADLPFQVKWGEWNWGTFYYFLFTMPNLAMLFSPLAVRLRARNKSRLRMMIGINLVCALYVFSWAFVVLLGKGGGTLLIGYYLWAASFVSLFIAMLQLRKRVRA